MYGAAGGSLFYSKQNPKVAIMQINMKLFLAPISAGSSMRSARD
jgi:hypothetical protein